METRVVAPTPTASGLILCDLVIVERDTSKVSMIGELNRLLLRSVHHIPGFFAFAVLSDSIGQLESELVITCLENEEDIYHSVHILTFANRLTQ